MKTKIFLPSADPGEASARGTPDVPADDPEPGERPGQKLLGPPRVTPVLALGAPREVQGAGAARLGAHASVTRAQTPTTQAAGAAKPHCRGRSRSRADPAPPAMQTGCPGLFPEKLLRAGAGARLSRHRVPPAGARPLPPTSPAAAGAVTRWGPARPRVRAALPPPPARAGRQEPQERRERQARGGEGGSGSARALQVHTRRADPAAASPGPPRPPCAWGSHLRVRPGRKLPSPPLQPQSPPL